MSFLVHPAQSMTQETFTDNNYRLFFGLALDVVLRPWEKLLMGLRFTEVGSRLPGTILCLVRRPQLGAIRLDRDLRSISTFLSSQTAFGDAREKFIRLQQISTLLNLDRVSVD